MGSGQSKLLDQDEIEEFALECGLDDETIISLYGMFEKAGELNYDKFREMTRVKDNPFSRSVFEALNQNGKGKMNFREFLNGYAVLKDPLVSFNDRANLMFYVMDHQNTGEVSEKDIKLSIEEVLDDFPEVKYQ